jgi:ATP-binding cassette subfamily B protein
VRTLACSLLGIIGALGTARISRRRLFTVIRGLHHRYHRRLWLLHRQLYASLQGLVGAPVEFSTSMVSFERVFEVIDLPQDIVEKPAARALHDVRGELEFDHVSFKYTVDEAMLLSDVKRYGRMENVAAVLSLADGESAERPKEDEAPQEPSGTSQARDEALDELSFVARPGQLIALVGPSGAGKTTLTYLIPRLYDPTEGAIRLDGHDLRDLKLETLSSAIGMVTQETYLFHDTIRTNLTYPAATRDEVEAMRRPASILRHGPANRYTIVGERGYRLSGGEKQRIALARVILKNPRILILDEATSSLDSESEALIQDALKRVMKGRTSIVIAHRLSTILAADMILVMDRGCRARHPSCWLWGVYSQLYETQFNRANVGV